MTSEDIHKVTIVQGPGVGREIELQPGANKIGRDAANGIVVDGQGVSRLHAHISLQAGRVQIEDLGSSNGTFVNGQRVSGGVQSLNSGDSIKLGQSVELRYTAPVQVEAAATIVEAEPIVGEPSRPPVVHTAPEPAGATIMSDKRAPAGEVSPAQTMMGDSFDLAAAAAPPELRVETAGSATQTILLTQSVYTIGRSEDNDIVVGSKIVSRHHARLEKTPQGYRVAQLPDVGNQMNYKGRPLSAPQDLAHGDVLRIGGIDPGTMVTLRYSAPETAAAGLQAVDITFGDRTMLQFGRDPDNDIRLDVPQVSRYHAQIERVGTRYRVRDLRSTNGTFVNGEPITGDVWLNTEDQVRIGPYRFVVGEDRLAQFDESGDLRVDVIGLNKWVRKNLNILQNISLVFNPREFIVVVGQSGGGKSTLVDAIAGYRPATHGQVLVNDIDIYKNFDAIRNEIGFVPQRDIIHMELTVFQALDFVAQLRMPSDTSKQERRERVMAVLDDLDLAHRKDVQISGLSGGQQKRVSIGVELLTKPGLFFLDEPTSGLDPGTETALMQLMRLLADQGRTIVLITHATKNVMLADKVVFLARGGYLAWFGPPDEALRYFDQFRPERDRRAGDMEFDEIYAILEEGSKGTPEDWGKRYLEHEAYQKHVLQPLQSRGKAVNGATAQAVRPVAGKTRKRQVSAIRQFLILSARNMKILTRDRFSLALMLAVAPIVGLLDFVLSILLGRNPFSAGEDGELGRTLITLFLFVFYGVTVGALAMMREFVREREIYKRERLVNLKMLPYVLSKVWVAVLLAFYQAAWYVLIRYLAFDMPGGVIEVALIYVTMVFATMAGMMLGLFASAMAPNSNSVPLIVILFIMPQVVLAGALIPLPTFVSAPFSTRWGFEAMVAITGIGSDVAADACWALPDEQRDALSLEDKEAFGCNCSGTAIFDTAKCNFPGLGVFYNETVDEAPPVEPLPLRDPPPEPTFPDQPSEPADQSDTIAMAEFFDELKVFDEQVRDIQESYKAELETFEIEASIYQAEVITYQESLGRWRIGRASAVEPAEVLIGKMVSDYSWTLVDKNDTLAFGLDIGSTWFAQGIIIIVLFFGILVFQKRKDVT